MRLPKRAKRSDRERPTPAEPTTAAERAARRAEARSQAAARRPSSPADDSGSTPDRVAEPAPRRRSSGRAAWLSASLTRAREQAAERLRGTGDSIPGRLAALLGALLALLLGLLRTLVALVVAALEWISGPGGELAGRVGDRIRSVSAAVTPVRAIGAAAIGCALLLGLSQFADYRGVAIGAESYSGVAAVAPAPEVDRAELGTAHGYAMVPLAIVLIALLVLAIRTARWKICRLVALAGLAVIAVSILVDRPTGLDEGGVARTFSDAEAQLLGGWWVQLFAGVALAVLAVLLADEIRRAGTAPAARRIRAGGERTPRAGLASPAGEAGA